MYELLPFFLNAVNHRVVAYWIHDVIFVHEMDVVLDIAFQPKDMPNTSLA